MKKPIENPLGERQHLSDSTINLRIQQYTIDSTLLQLIGTFITAYSDLDFSYHFLLVMSYEEKQLTMIPVGDVALCYHRHNIVGAVIIETEPIFIYKCNNSDIFFPLSTEFYHHLKHCELEVLDSIPNYIILDPLWHLNTKPLMVNVMLISDVHKFLFIPPYDLSKKKMEMLMLSVKKILALL